MANITLHHPYLAGVRVLVDSTKADGWKSAGWVEQEPDPNYVDYATVQAVKSGNGHELRARFDDGKEITFPSELAGRTFYGRPLQPSTNRFAFISNGGLLSNGTDTGMNTNTIFYMTRDTQSVALAFSNIADYNGAAAPNSITVRAGVEVNGALVPVYFNGRRDAVIEPDGLVISDPVGAPLGTGAGLTVRTRVTVASGEKWPNTVLTDNSLGEGVEAGTTTTDKTTTGTITASRSYGYAPFTVLANPGKPGATRTLVGVGDSIMAQAHDSVNAEASTVSTLGWGFARRWAHTNSTPFLNLGVIGDTVQGWANSGGRKYALRRSLAADGAVALVNFGRNDLDNGRTLDQIKADLTATWEQLNKLGIKVHQATVTPKTTSTDSWATAAGQAVTASEAVRVGLNDWIRTTPAPLAGYVETADTVETARNSGIWKTDGTAKTFTTDGTHPAAAGHDAMADAIPASLMA